MLIKDQKVKRDIPHEDGEWVEIRRLSWRELEAAQEARQVKAVSMMRAMGGDVLEALRSAESRQAAAERPPEQVYDRATVLHHGVVAWSYDAELSAENLDQLDDITADWLFRQIIQQHVESDEAKKKGSSPSTAH